MSIWAAVVLAAGKGKRMKSKRPKVLHEICGRPMVSYVLDAVSSAGVSDIVIVVGHGAGDVRAALGDGFVYAEQREQMGTGHAVGRAEAHIPPATTHVLVLNGDIPFLTAETLRRMMTTHERAGATVTLLTAEVPSPDGLGRIVRDEDGGLAAIVEEAEATEEQRRIQEINVGVYCFQTSWLWASIGRLEPRSVGESYVTDLPGMALADGLEIETPRAWDAAEAMGIDTRIRLAEAEAIVRQRIRERWMLDGVTILDPASTFIDATVTIGQDSVIHPHTTLSGRTSIGEDCAIGPRSILADSTVGRECTVTESVLEGAVLEEHVEIGPYSHLRPGAYIEAETHIGNFVEVKKSRLGRGVAVGHFSYIGDATIGRNVNVGAGTITCNYDGVRKLPTVIEDDVFIGCDTMLIAPVKMGARSKSGAGAVINRDVPEDTLVAGVPARPIVERTPDHAGSQTLDAKPPSTAGQEGKG